MKRPAVSALFVLLLVNIVQAQYFNDTLDFGGDEFAKEIVRTDTGYLLLGEGYFPEYKILLISLDEEMQVNWSRKYQYNNNATTAGLMGSLTTLEGRIIISGWYSATVGGPAKPLLLILDDKGNVLSMDSMAVHGTFYSHCHLGSGNVAVAGSIVYGSNRDLLIALFDSSGNYIDHTSFGSTGSGESGISVVELEDGSLLISGYRYQSITESDPLIVKFDQNLNYVWVKHYNLGPWNDGAIAMTKPVGDYVFAGGHDLQEEILFPDLYSGKNWLAKIRTSDGEIVWERRLGPSVIPRGATKVLLNDDSTVTVLSAGTYGTEINQDKNDIGRLDVYSMDGDSIRSVLFEYKYQEPSPIQNQPISMARTPEGGLLVFGYVYLEVPHNLWLMQFDSNLCFDPEYMCTVGLDEMAGSGEAAFDIYPVPARDELNIRAATSGNRDYRITDVYGRTVAAGRFSGTATLDVAALPAGVYVVGVLENNGNTYCQKFVKR